MKLLIKKLEVADLGQLQSLILEHLDEIEPGLTVLDSRLLLGDATIDVVAIDPSGALVLTAVGFTADEEMLLKAVEAYSWCLEYPDAIRRLYPSVEVSAARPPRLMFVVERLPDAFHRKIKQLGFSEVDCVEFRHLDVSGTPAAYFDTIAKLRRGVAPAAERTVEPVVRRAPEPIVRQAPEPIVAERVAEKVADRDDKVVPIAAPFAVRATSVRLQKLLHNGASEAAPARLAERATVLAPVIDIAARAVAAAVRAEAPAPRVEAPRPEPQPVPQPVVIRQAVAARAVAVAAPAAVIEPIARVALREAVAAPVAVAVAAAAPARVAPAPERRVSFAEIAKELLGGPAPQPRLEAPAVIPRPPVEEITRAALEEIAAAAAQAIAEPRSAVAVEDAPVEETPIETPADMVVALEEELSAEPVALVAAEIPEPVIVAPAPAPVPVPAPKAEAAATTPSLPQAFEGLQFPNDGVLTRQWMEFLNQMAATK